VLRFTNERAAREMFRYPPRGCVVQGMQIVDYGKACEYTIDIPAGGRLIYNPALCTPRRISRLKPPWA